MAILKQKAPLFNFDILHPEYVGNSVRTQLLRTVSLHAIYSKFAERFILLHSQS